MKAIRTTEATQLAIFLYRLAQLPLRWIRLGRGIRAEDKDGYLLICPISAVYGGDLSGAIRKTECPGVSRELRRTIVHAADGAAGYDRHVREALMRAVHLGAW